MVKNPAPARAGFAIKIRQNLALAGFGNSKSGKTLVFSHQVYFVVVSSFFILQF